MEIMNNAEEEDDKMLNLTIIPFKEINSTIYAACSYFLELLLKLSSSFEQKENFLFA